MFPLFSPMLQSTLRLVAAVSVNNAWESSISTAPVKQRLILQLC